MGISSFKSQTREWWLPNGQQIFQPRQHLVESSENSRFAVNGGFTDSGSFTQAARKNTYAKITKMRTIKTYWSKRKFKYFKLLNRQ